MTAPDLGVFADDPRILNVAQLAVHVSGGQAHLTVRGRWAAMFDFGEHGYSFGTLDDALRFLLGKPQPATKGA